MCAPLLLLFLLHAPPRKQYSTTTCRPHRCFVKLHSVWLQTSSMLSSHLVSLHNTFYAETRILTATFCAETNSTILRKMVGSGQLPGRWCASNERPVMLSDGDRHGVRAWTSTPPGYATFLDLTQSEKDHTLLIQNNAWSLVGWLLIQTRAAAAPHCSCTPIGCDVTAPLSSLLSSNN